MKTHNLESKKKDSIALKFVWLMRKAFIIAILKPVKFILDTVRILAE
ncbi:MAG: hypothetical protein LBI56_00485 [Puniceicoccales bacterium]|nr:hypothetical protein [Puniceicoccales bacterium]